MKRVGWAALTLAAMAGLQAMGQQGVEIRYVWKSGEPPTLIYDNGACKDGFMANQLCGNVDAHEEWFNVGFLTFASLAEAMSYYLSSHEGTGLFCITLPIGSMCLWDG